MKRLIYPNPFIQLERYLKSQEHMPTNVLKLLRNSKSMSSALA